jgi:CheY-like chemotaxis protein
MPGERIRVLLVDDHAVVRSGLRAFLELLDDIEIVGEAADGAEAVRQVAVLTPDVVVMDLLMPNMDGIAATAAIRHSHPDVEVLALTSFIEEDKVTAALEAGASGYLLKDAEADEVAGRSARPTPARSTSTPRWPACSRSECGAVKPRRTWSRSRSGNGTSCGSSARG